METISKEMNSLVENWKRILRELFQVLLQLNTRPITKREEAKKVRDAYKYFNAQVTETEAKKTNDKSSSK